MSILTVSLPDFLNAQIETRFKEAGFSSKEEYLLALARADCEQSKIEMVLEHSVNDDSHRVPADKTPLDNGLSKKQGQITL